MNGRELDISADLLRLISDKTGLASNWYPSIPRGALQPCRAGRDRPRGWHPYDYDLARERHLSMTRPYISSQYLLMMKEGAARRRSGAAGPDDHEPLPRETVGQSCATPRWPTGIRAVEPARRTTPMWTPIWRNFHQPAAVPRPQADPPDL
ncbi:MAG: hypothetical protein ACLVL7_01020 [Anaerotruncus massiliensis (ex Togo et al. 2019)]